MAGLPITRIHLLADNAHLNPVERVFRKIRRRTESRVYAAVADKSALAQPSLASLAGDPERVRRICGWAWLTDALDDRPAPPVA